MAVSVLPSIFIRGCLLRLSRRAQGSCSKVQTGHVVQVVERSLQRSPGNGARNADPYYSVQALANHT